MFLVFRRFMWDTQITMIGSDIHLRGNIGGNPTNTNKIIYLKSITCHVFSVVINPSKFVATKGR